MVVRAARLTAVTTWWRPSRQRGHESPALTPTCQQVPPLMIITAGCFRPSHHPLSPPTQFPQRAGGLYPWRLFSFCFFLSLHSLAPGCFCFILLFWQPAVCWCRKTRPPTHHHHHPHHCPPSVLCAGITEGIHSRDRRSWWGTVTTVYPRSRQTRTYYRHSSVTEGPEHFDRPTAGDLVTGVLFFFSCWCYLFFSFPEHFVLNGG